MYLVTISSGQDQPVPACMFAASLKAVNEGQSVEAAAIDPTASQMSIQPKNFFNSFDFGQCGGAGNSVKFGATIPFDFFGVGAVVPRP